MSFLAELLAQYRDVPRPVYYIALGRAINSLGSFVIILATIILSESWELSPSSIGVILFMCGTAQAVGTVFSGSLLDRFPRQYVFTLFMAGHAAAFGSAVFAGSAGSVAVCLVIGFFFGGMLRPGMFAMAADLTTSANRHAAFSLIYLAHNMGMIAAPMFAGFLYGTRAALIFWGDAATTLVCAGIVFLAFGGVRSRRSPDPIADPGPDPAASSSSGDQRDAKQNSVIRTLVTSRSLFWFTLAMMLLNFVYAQHMFALPLRMLDLYADQGSLRFGFLLTTNALYVILATGVITTVTRRMAAPSAMALAGLTYAVGFGAVGLSGVFGIQVLLVTIWTTGEIIMATHAGVFVTRYAPERARARFLATLPTIWWIGSALGPFVMGPVADRFGLGTVWPILFIISLAGIMLFRRARRAEVSSR